MIAKTVLIDTGPIVAMLSGRDAYHTRCVEQARALPRNLFTCWPVITEAAFILRNSPGAVDRLLERVSAGALTILPLTESDAEPIRSILAKYADQQFDFADACLMHLAKREAIERVFTIDRRHFAVFQTATGSLEIVP
ncbi:MAG: PIN domain-containing protein [Pirellulales bacterium]